MFWTIFDHTDMKLSLYRVVFRVEFEFDLRFCAALQKLMNNCEQRRILIDFYFREDGA